MHTGPPSSMISQPPCSLPHTEHVKSPSGEATTSSGERFWRSANLARFRSDSSGEIQCVRYARSMSGLPDLENRSGRRSRVRERTRSRSASTPAPAPSDATTASRSRSSPGSRPSPARDNRPGPGATHQPYAAQASRRRPARRSRYELALRKRRLRRPNHPAIDLPAIAGHLERTLHPAAPHGRIRLGA